MRSPRLSPLAALLLCACPPIYAAETKPAPMALPFTEQFSAEKLDPAWSVHAAKENSVALQASSTSPERKARGSAAEDPLALRSGLVAGGLQIRARQDSKAHIKRNLNVDLVRVTCSLRPEDSAACAAVILCWDKENSCELGIHAGRIRLREVLGTYAHDYDFGPWPEKTECNLVIELAKDCVRYLAGEPAQEAKPLRISRKPARYAALPATLVIGDGPETTVFVRPTPFWPARPSELFGTTRVSRVEVTALEPERRQATAAELAAMDADERDTLGEAEMSGPGDPTFESVARHFPPFKYPREAIGIKDHPDTIGVAYDGGLQFTDNSAKFGEPTGAFEIGDYRFGSGAPCKRALVNGWMPAVILTDKHDDLELEQTAFGYAEDFSPDKPLTGYVRLKISNRGQKDRELDVNWRVRTATGVPSSLSWKPKIAAGGVEVVCLKAPFATKKSPALEITAAEFTGKLAEVTAYWEKLIAAGSLFEVPEQRVQDGYRAWLAYNFINVHKRGDVYHVCDGSGFYSQVYGYSAALYCNKLDMLGYHELADKYMDSLLTFTRPDGLLHVHFGDTDTGAALWSISEHYRITRDAARLRRLAPQMIKMCDWIIRERKKALSQAASQPAVTRGFIRYKPYADLLHPAADYFSNSYLCKGLTATAGVFAEIGMTEEAARIQKEADAYRRDITASMDAAVFEDRGMKILPAIPDTHELWKESNGSANGYYGLVAGCMLESGIPAADDPKATLLIDALRRRGGLVLGVSRFHDLIDHAYAYGYWMTCLQRDDVKPLILGLYGSMAYGMTHDTFAAVECTDVRSGGNYWTLPHTYSNTQQLRLLRNMLVFEKGDDLLLGYAVPRHWLAPGQRVAVREAPTTFGTVSYSLQSEADAVKVHVEPPTRTTPQTIKIRARHPGQREIRRVDAPEDVSVAYKNDVVELRGLKKAIDLTIRY